MRSIALNKRLAVLETRAKPRLIATLADFVLWHAEDEPDRNVEFSPQMQEFVDESLKCAEENNKLSDP
jgi:hypothetical protein